MERKAFNFYRSYYEVLDGLPDKDKLDFLMGLIERQFTGKEPQLTGLSRSVYNGQRHSIDSQIQGWEHKMKTKLTPPPTEGGTQGGYQPPTQGGTEGGTEPPTEGSSKNGHNDTVVTTDGGTQGGYDGGTEPPSVQEEEEEKEYINTINLSTNLSSGEKSMLERLKQKFLNDGLSQEESIEYSKSLLNLKTIEECEFYLKG